MKAICGYDTREGICLIVKENGKRVPKYIPFEKFYFYILKSDYPAAEDILTKYQDLKLVKLVLHGNHKYTRIYCDRETKNYPTIDMLRVELEERNVQVFEFDLTKTKRYLIDFDVKIETDLNILYFDIETDDSKGGIEVGRDKILSWAATDKKENIFFETGSERELLKKFIKLIENYDVITGWNSEQFDLPYIQLRCEKFGIKYNWKNIIHLDMLQRCFKIYSYEASIIGLRNFSLNEVVKAFLGKTKTELEGMKVHELHKKRPELLKEYNINDAVLLRELDTKLSIIPLMIQECDWTGSFLNKFYIGELLDNYILREARREHKILGSRPSEKRKKELENMKIIGGYVMPPVKGMYKDVHVCDFKSLYPSIIVGWNIGMDSLDSNLTDKGQNGLATFLEGRKIEEIPFEEWNSFLKKEKLRLDPDDLCFQTANNAYFKRDIQSFIGTLVVKLLDQRKAYKKKLKELQFDTPEYNNTYAAERVVKEMANSMFGITCDKNSRYFDKHVSEGITYTGQYLNKMSAWVAKGLGFNPIYGDTDSIFIVNAPDMEKGILDINKGLKDILDNQHRLVRNIVSLDYEKKYRRFILMEKKRYTGQLCMKDGKEIDKIFSRGTEDVKKSNIRFTKKAFKELTTKLFDDSFTKEDAIKYIENLRGYVRNHIIDPGDLTITTKVSKEIAHYKTMSLSARLAKRLIEEGKLAPIVESEKKIGTRLEYIIVSQNGKNEGVPLDEYTGEWNRDHYWEVQIYAPLKRILETVFQDVDWNQFDELTPQLTLFDV